MPQISLPMPPGWADAGPATPEYAYNAAVGVDPALQPDPPTIIAVLSKLTGNVDPAQILELAPNEVRNLPDFKGSDPQPGKFSNFDNTAIAGTYTRKGQDRVIEQTTVVIPAKDGLYVLQINVDGVKGSDQGSDADRRHHRSEVHDHGLTTSIPDRRRPGFGMLTIWQVFRAGSPRD